MQSNDGEIAEFNPDKISSYLKGSPDCLCIDR